MYGWLRGKKWTKFCCITAILIARIEVVHVLFHHIKRSHHLRWESDFPARTMLRKTPIRQLITKKIWCPRPALLGFSTTVI